MTTKKAIEIQAIVESTHEFYRAEYDFREIIFSDYDSLMSYDSVASKMKTVLKKIGSWSMITLSLNVRDEYQLPKDSDVVISFRFIKERCGKVLMSKFNGHSYPNFHEESFKTFMPILKDMTEQANREYIALIKQTA